MQGRDHVEPGTGRCAPGRSAGPALLLGAVLALGAFGALPTRGQEMAVGTRTPRPSVTPTPGCVAAAHHRADPPRLRLGQATTATLHVALACPPAAEPLHIVLVLDLSSAMREEMAAAALRGAEQLARDLRLAENRSTRLGIVAFNENDRRRCGLGGDEDRALACLRSARGLHGARPIGRQRWTLDHALLEGHHLLRLGRVGLDPARLREALLLFSVGPREDDCGPLLKASRTVKGDGILLVTVCVGADCNAACLRAVASSPRYFFQIDNAGGLAGIFPGSATTASSGSSCTTSRPPACATFRTALGRRPPSRPRAGA